MITLQPLTRKAALVAVPWRNVSLEGLRTPEGSIEEGQERWFESLDPFKNRYWGVYADSSESIGLAGLTNISWENRSAEISLIINPTVHGKGYGKETVEALIDHGFNRMNLDIIYGECYHCNSALSFWKKVLPEAKWVVLPDRKYWNGKYYESSYFSIRRTK